MTLLLGGDAGLLDLLGSDWLPRSDVAIILPSLDAAGQPGTRAALEWLRSLEPQARVLLVSSTEAQAPIYSHPGQTQERSAKALSGSHASSERWCHFEQAVAEEAEARGVACRVLRAAPVISLGGRDFWSRRFSRRFAFKPAGFSPPVQFLHVEDLRSALVKACEVFDQLPEVIHIVPEDALPLSRALKLAGVTRISLPFSLLWLGSWILSRLGGPCDAADLDRLRYSSTASGKAFVALGYLPRHGTAAALSQAAPEDLRHDPFGLDRDVINKARRTAFRFLRAFWWRIDQRGAHHVPASGPVILLGVHRGLVPFDAMMALDAIVAETGRVPRFLIHPALLRFPFIGDLMRGLGGVVACRENAHWVLERGEILGLFPEGVRGAFSPYRETYKLQRFGRAEFVRLAIRHRATCALFVTLGSAEVFPILKTIDWPWWKKWSGWPCFPLTPTPLPLPVKWHTLFLPPLDIEAEKADAKLVKHYAALVYERLQETLLAMRRARRSWFWGRAIPIEDQPLPSRSISSKK